MTTTNRIIEAALSARTLEDADRVQKLIGVSIGARHERPLGDRWNNVGLISSAGSFEHKTIEPVTNMHDAVLERLAMAKFGSLDAIPFSTPEEAATALLAGRDFRGIADDVAVTFYESDPPANRTKKLTIAYRDHGCGLEPGHVHETIFALGSAHKSKSVWQQGAFGLGGASTFRNAGAVVLVSRRAPEMNPKEDRILVAVAQWQAFGKTQNIFHLTTTEWAGPGSTAEPWSAPAAEYPEFEVGNYLALISYGVEGFHRARLGDERSFDTVLNTRLFEPVMPVRFSNELLRRDRSEYLRGLKRRLDDNPRADRREGEEHLPYNMEGTTYHLPVRFAVFAAPGDAGERRNFVARDHAVVFTSNGQVHHHWTPQDFRYKTRLNKLYDRVFVVVETDELPIELRTALFTYDRAGLLKSEDAIRLEAQVAAFLDDWAELAEINGDLIREAVNRSAGTESALSVARQISAALKVRGFSLSGVGGSGGGAGSVGGGRTKPIDTYPDPTTLEGPEHVLAEDGKTKFVGFVLNAHDDFIPERGQLVVTCTHPEINGRETTVGQLRNGRIRVSVAVPQGAQQGEFELEASITGWHRAGGGLGSPLKWTTEFEVVDEIKPTRSRSGKDAGKKGAGEGGLVAVIWDTLDNHADWNNGVPGHVEDVPASTLAERPEYAELASAGDVSVPTIWLNQEYGPLKTYIGARSRELTTPGLDAAKERYAVGAGLGLLYLRQQFDRRATQGETISDEVELDAKQAVARSSLSMMPFFDRLARESGLDG